MYSFEARTGRVSIDHEKCLGCMTFACAKACSLYGSGILRVEKGKPVLNIPLEEAKRRCIECLACEIDCSLQGQQAITISLPIAGLAEYRRAVYGHSA
ncbi:MAG: hypothetical protein HY871_05680 [Chloroflexi bacterium]|nr:hypothetical protein [Chloroflexota bacterium]